MIEVIDPQTDDHLIFLHANLEPDIPVSPPFTLITKATPFPASAF